MPFPNVTFSNFLDNLTREELEHLCAQLEGYLRVEHDEDGRHTDITADSITVDNAVEVGGDGLFDGDVIALNGSGLEVGLGILTTVDGTALNPGSATRRGLLIGGTTGYWFEHRAAASPFTAGNELRIYDLTNNTNAPLLRIGNISGTMSIIDGGTGASALRIGGSTDSPAIIGTTITAEGALTAETTLDVDGAVNLNSTLTVDGAVDVNTTLVVDGTATLNSTLQVVGALTANSSCTVTGGLVAQDRLTAEDEIVFSGEITPAQITADQNDYNPTNLATCRTLVVNTDAARSITGLQQGVAGRELLLINNGSFDISLPHESVSSTAANRFSCPGYATFTWTQGMTVHAKYRNTRWWIK